MIAVVRLGDDRSVKIKSLEAAKIMKIKWLVLVRAVRIPDKSSKTDGAGSSLPDLVK